MKKNFPPTALLVGAIALGSSFSERGLAQPTTATRHAAEKSDHDKKPAADREHEHSTGKDEHGDHQSDGQEEDDEHGHSAEEDHQGDNDHDDDGAGMIGPAKGITAKGKNGFTLSPEAWSSFEIKTLPLAEGATIPPAAVVHIKDGKYYYRVREGWIKRVPLGMKPAKGDLLIVAGTGFVRTAELVTEEGVSHGHSH